MEPGIGQHVGGNACGPQRRESQQNLVVFFRPRHQLSLNGSKLGKKYDKICISFLEAGKHHYYGCTKRGSLGVLVFKVPRCPVVEKKRQCL